MVEGTIYLVGYTARVLFDPSGTHSFISSTFASKLNKEPEPLKFQLEVSTPIGVEMVTSMYYKECEFYEEVKKQADLVK